MPQGYFCVQKADGCPEIRWNFHERGGRGPCWPNEVRFSGLEWPMKGVGCNDRKELEQYALYDDIKGMRCD
jgi:hypothetical protein